jgi:hypothetical protein
MMALPPVKFVVLPIPAVDVDGADGGVRARSKNAHHVGHLGGAQLNKFAVVNGVIGFAPGGVSRPHRVLHSVHALQPLKPDQVGVCRVESVDMI